MGHATCSQTLLYQAPGSFITSPRWGGNHQPKTFSEVNQLCMNNITTVSTISRQKHPIFGHLAKSTNAEGCAWDEFIVESRVRLRTGAAAARRSALAHQKVFGNFKALNSGLHFQQKNGRFLLRICKNKSAHLFVYSYFF